MCGKVSFSCDLSALPLVFPCCRYSVIRQSERHSARQLIMSPKVRQCHRHDFHFKNSSDLSHRLILLFVRVYLLKRERESERNGGWCAGWFRECSMTCCRLERGPSRGDSEARPGLAPSVSPSVTSLLMLLLLENISLFFSRCIYREDLQPHHTSTSCVCALTS